MGAGSDPCPAAPMAMRHVSSILVGLGAFFKPSFALFMVQTPSYNSDTRMQLGVSMGIGFPFMVKYFFS